MFFRSVSVSPHVRSRQPLIPFDQIWRVGSYDRGTPQFYLDPRISPPQLVINIIVSIVTVLRVRLQLLPLYLLPFTLIFFLVFVPTVSITDPKDRMQSFIGALQVAKVKFFL